MTSTIVPNPFPGEQGIRIEKALRHVTTHLHRPRFEDALAALRLYEGLSDDDFRTSPIYNEYCRRTSDALHAAMGDRPH